MKTKSNMKTKSVVSVLCALLGFAALAGSLDVAAVNGSEVNLTTGVSDGWLALSGTDIKVSTTIGGDNGNGIIDSTHNGNSMTFTLNCDAKSRYSFSYQGGTHAATVSWKLDGATVGSDAFEALGGQNPPTIKSHSLGLLEAGEHTLVGTIACSQTWGGNYGHFIFTKSSTLAIDGTYELSSDEDWKDKYVSIAAGSTINLKGHNLTLDDTTAYTATVTFTNSESGDASVLTIDGSASNDFLKSIVVTGNVKLAVDSIDSRSFPTKADIALNPLLINTLTGGVYFNNVEMQVWNFATNCGSGTVTFGGNATIKMDSNNGYKIDGYKTISNNIVVEGENNTFTMGTGNDDALTFDKNSISGSGNLYIKNGWKPFIVFKDEYGHNIYQNFTGELSLGYAGAYSSIDDCVSANKFYGYRLDYRAFGFPNAKVKLTTKTNAGTETQQTRLWLTPGWTYNKIYFGSLYTDGAGVDVHANTAVIACRNNSGGAPIELYIGSADGAGVERVFEGSFVEHVPYNATGTSTFKLIKQGGGSLELKGTNASAFTDGITVSAGTLILNTTVSTATAVTVAEGAQFYGTVPASGSVTYQSGAIIDCDTAHTITGNVDLSNVIVAGSNPSEGVFLTVNGTATGKPSVSAALAAVPKHNGKHGKWIVDDATANGVTTYSLVWRPTGLIIIVR